MLDVKTPLSKVHRASRRIAATFTAVPGIWGYISTGVINNIANNSTNQTQPKVLKMILGNASTSIYESNDIEVGSISIVEGVFRATVDGNGYQVLDSSATALVYAAGDPLTPAYKITSTPANTCAFADTADIGKLRLALAGEIVVARVEVCDTVNSQLTFETVTPYAL